MEIPTRMIESPMFDCVDDYFSIRGRNIQYIGEDEVGAHLLGSTPLNDKHYFSVRVIKVGKIKLEIGVSDYRNACE